MTHETLIELALAALGIGLVSLPIVLWVRGLRRRGRRSPLPHGFTDDMRISLPPHVTAAALASFVLDHALQSVPDAEPERRVADAFGLSPADAAPVRDRGFGGVLRGAIARRNAGLTGEGPARLCGSFQCVRSQPGIAARASAVRGTADRIAGTMLQACSADGFVARQQPAAKEDHSGPE